MTWANKLTFFLACAVIAFTTLAYGAVHQPVLAIFYLLVSLMTIMWAVDSYLSESLRYSTSLLQLPLVAAAIYGVIQAIPFGTLAETAGLEGIGRTISADPNATMLSAAHLIALLAFFSLTLVTLESRSRLRTMVTFITVFGFAFAFFAIIQSVLSPTKIYGIYEARYAVPFGSFVNRHNFAAFMEMTIALPLGMLFTGSIRPDKRLLYITAASLMGIALLLSASRGGFIALIAELVILAYLTRRKKGSREMALRIALVSLLVLTIVGGAFFVGGDTSLTRFVETAQSQDVSTNRTHIWNVTLKVIGNNMPFGAGLGAFGVAYTPFDTRGGLERVEQAHNDYLETVADLGIVGIFIGGFFLYWFVRSGLQNTRVENHYRRGIAVGAFAGCCAVLVHSMFDFVLHTTALSVLFLTLLSMLVASGVSYPDDVHGHKRVRRSKRGMTNVRAITASRRVR